MSATVINPPSIAQPAEELRAAALAAEAQAKAAETAPAVTAPPASAPDAPYTFTKGADGSVELTLKSGQVYKGASQEAVLAELAKAQISATETIRQLNEARKAEAAPVATAAPATTEEDILAAEVARLWGKGVGIQDPKQIVADIAQERAERHQQAIAHQFHASCPDFPGDRESVDKLYEYMAEAGLVDIVPVVDPATGKQKLDDNGKAQFNVVGETLGKLKAAHAACVQYGIYKPLTPEQQQQALGAKTAAQTSAPAPVIATGGQGTATTSAAAFGGKSPLDRSVSLEQVRQWAEEASRKK